MLIAFLCSLAINLVFVGAVVGRLIGHQPRGGEPMSSNLGWIIHYVSEEKRGELREQMKEHILTTRPLRREMRNAQQEFETVLANPEISEVELDEALARLRSSSESFQEAMHEQMVELIKRLEPDERKQVVEFLRRQRPHGDRDSRREYQQPPP